MAQTTGSQSPGEAQATSGQTRRQRQRQATLDEIVATSRALLREPADLSLRAVAQKMGITAPALYRYVASYQELVDLVAFDIDNEATRLLQEARDSHPEDDPAARIVSAAIAFRRWALNNKKEFGLLFANPLAESTCLTPEQLEHAQTGYVFTDLLAAVWAKYRFPVPSLDELEPVVVEVLADPVIPAHTEELPEEARGLVWLFMRGWAALYGTVTLEVFGHLDPRVIESGAMFRAMLDEQAQRFGIAHELPRLRTLIAAEMSR